MWIGGTYISNDGTFTSVLGKLLLLLKVGAE